MLKMGMKLFVVVTLISVTVPYKTSGYIPMSSKDHYISDVLLRDLVDRMGKDLLDNDDVYIDPLANMPAHLALMSRAATKDQMDNSGGIAGGGEQLDYDTLLDGGNPAPSLRDQEYLQHSTLWGHQYVSGGAGEGPHRIKPQIKTDATLPAYCNPPNPCPYGYTEDQGCIIDFENTAAFSREYQSSQECMCDAEHMFECSNSDQSDDNRQMASDIESFLTRQFNVGDHKNLVAKKFHLSAPLLEQHYKELDEQQNPFLQGEKLPIAAKKGINVY